DHQRRAQLVLEVERRGSPGPQRMLPETDWRLASVHGESDPLERVRSAQDPGGYRFPVRREAQEQKRTLRNPLDLPDHPAARRPPHPNRRRSPLAGPLRVRPGALVLWLHSEDRPNEVPAVRSDGEGRDVVAVERPRGRDRRLDRTARRWVEPVKEPLLDNLR